MEEERFLSGYCRQLDAPRMVETIWADGQLCQADCCYDSCAYRDNCPIAGEIRDIAKENGQMTV